MKPRLTILGLMALVLYAAVVSAALRNPTPLWSSALYTLTGLSFLAGVVCSARHEGPGRDFWLGYGVFGLGHLVAAYWPSAVPAVAPQLLTAALSDVLVLTLRGDVAKIEMSLGLTSSGFAEISTRQIGYSLASLLVGVVGGAATARVFADRPRPGE